MFGRRRKDSDASSSDRTLTADLEKSQLRRATRPRFLWGFITSFLLLISVTFLILVLIGDTSVNPTLSNIYFIKLDVSDIVPTRVPDATLLNSIAQTLGLHDFYTVGLWGFCEGYNGEGTTSCSDPQTMYWFNPVEILQSQLLAGATIALPAQVDTILNLIRLVSHWMFGLFLTGACLNFLLIFLVPLGVYTRWATFPLMLFTFLGALFTTVAAVIATVMFIIMQNAVTAVANLNIKASIGLEMFIFMWIAAGAAVIAWLVQAGMCCCCASRRDVRTGRKRGSRAAWRDSEVPAMTAPATRAEEVREKKKSRWGRKRQEEAERERLSEE